MHIILVNIDINFLFEKYIHWFYNDDIKKIYHHSHRINQIRAFASLLLKCFYLAKIHNLKPQDIVFKYSKYNKPMAMIAHSQQNIPFNISHSGDYVIMNTVNNSYHIYNNNYHLGIDIELMKIRISNINNLAKKICSDDEIILIDNDIKKFYVIWTKKEAFLKAYGCGFHQQIIYKTTQLNLDNYQVMNNSNHYYQQAIIYTSLIDDGYIMSACLLQS